MEIILLGHSGLILMSQNLAFVRENKLLKSVITFLIIFR